MDMNWKKIVMAFLLAAGLPAAQKAQAQTTYEEMEQLTVNEQVTTVITASEPVRFVDISTDKVAGDQPIDNVIRLKPKEAGHPQCGIHHLDMGAAQFGIGERFDMVGKQA